MSGYVFLELGVLLIESSMWISVNCLVSKFLCRLQPYRHLIACCATLSYLDGKLLKLSVIVKYSGIRFEVIVVALLWCNFLYCKVLLTSLFQISLFIFFATYFHWFHYSFPFWQHILVCYMLRRVKMLHFTN